MKAISTLSITQTLVTWYPDGICVMILVYSNLLSFIASQMINKRGKEVTTENITK